MNSWSWHQIARKIETQANDIIKDKYAEIDQLKMKLVALKKLYVAK